MMFNQEAEQEVPGQLLIAFVLTAHQPTPMVLCPVLGRLLPLVKEFSSPTEEGVWNEETQPS